MGGVEHGPAIDREKQFDPSFLKPGNPIEHRIRAICREEISQHVEMAKSLAAFSEQLKPKECEQCKKLQTMLDMARSALEKVVGMDPQAAAQRAQMNMPAEHDIARMTLTEIKRMENADG